MLPHEPDRLHCQDNASNHPDKGELTFPGDKIKELGEINFAHQATILLLFCHL